MTETTTADATTADAEDLLGAAERAARDAGAKTLATIEPEQVRFNDDQIAILRALGVEDASDGDLNLFFHVCRTTGLDPFRKQIYMIGRNTKLTEWVDDERATNGRRKVERWVTKYTIQTGIDGYRRNGREAAKMLDDELRFEGPYFTGADDFHITDDGEVIQHWRKVWPAGSVPHAARFVIYRNGEPFEGIAHFDEFVQTNAVWDGEGRNRRIVAQEPNSMWAKMPRNQIAKCAEALAWRRAYPDDFSGLILEDAAQPTVIDPDGNVESGPEPEKRRPAGGSGIGGVRAARERKQQQRRGDVIDGEVISEEPAGEPASDSSAEPEPEQVSEPESEPSPADAPTADLRKSMRDKLNGAISATFGELDLNGDDQRDDRLIVCRAIVGRDIASTKDLTDDELQKLRNGLIDRKRDGTLKSDVTEWLNIAELQRLEAQQVAEEAAAAAPSDDEPADS
ncbi:recombinase RecT [Mycobacterium hackensackense]|uniref:recombinase RecT n=1 Tax=Mycobacterium hackensackense TaxID=228909 RepID=UPI002265F43F|nr:recombinase RecT [Mycobacterium hackensackense]MCV7255642.1 recombinase RecT [Mycobacterium hackensackense]